MLEVFKRHGVNLFWTFGILLVAFLFYAATSAFMPYPGLSSEYFTALCFPTHAEPLLTSPIDTVLFSTLLKCIAPEHINVVFSLIYAGIGALIVACLFRCAIATARISTIDLTGIREHELDRTLFAISHVSFETGLGAALLALPMLPIWATATRPYPQALLAFFAVAALTCAMEFRWRIYFRHHLGLPPRLPHGILIGAAYALTCFILFTIPQLAPVGALALLLASGCFINPEVKGRGTYLLFAGGGILLGLMCAIGVVSTAAHLRNLSQDPLPSAVLIWGQSFATQLAGLVSTYTTFEALAPLVIFLLAAALYLGCFPYAYLKIGAPVIGQLVCITLCVLAFIQWPTSIWQLLEEPTAMSIAGIFMIVLCVSAIFGSWLHAFYSAKFIWSQWRIRTTALITLLVVMGTFSIALALKNAPVASGLPLRQAMEAVAPQLDSLLPAHTRLWLTAERDTLGIIARRYVKGNPVHPQSENLTAITSETLKRHPTLKRLLGEDPLIHRLATIGAEPLRQYLLSADEDLGIIRTLPPQETAFTAAQIAETLTTTEFGQTPIGKRSITWMKALAAREHAACAISAEPEAAATHLRLARTLDPENPGVPLSLVALAMQGISITQDERNAARDIVEAKPSLRAPNETEALLFEYRYGPVCAPGFCSASRLRRFHLGNATTTLQEILQLYRTAPDQLSTTEKLVAVLHLPADEVAQLLADRGPEHGDMELFFCLYPDHPATESLHQKHRFHFSRNDALNTLFRERNSRLRERIPDKMQAFFLRDGTFAYALYYVNALIKAEDLDTAIQFVGGFNVRERLRKTPVLVEDLCYRVLEQLLQRDPARARSVCEKWLRSDARQYRLWKLLLSDQMPPSADPEAELEACLRTYPLHPSATARYAELLEKELGAEIATRYREAVKKSTAEGSCLQKDSHAHRRL